MTGPSIGRPTRVCPACGLARRLSDFSKAAEAAEQRCLRCVRAEKPALDRSDARLPKLRGPSAQIKRECLACNRAFVAPTRFLRLCVSCRPNTDVGGPGLVAGAPGRW